MGLIMMQEPKLRPATREDIIVLRGQPYNESFRGIVADLNGEILGIAGVLHTPTLKRLA